MKTLKNLNTLALLLSLVTGLACFLNKSLFLLASLSIITTGFVQLLIGIYFWSIHPKNIHIKFYFLLVLVFFGLIYFKGNDNWFWIMPPLLCLYISILIYNQKETK